jgi:hypothetical protein
VPNLNDLTQWIEDHSTTVDLLKWLVLLLLAWAVGVFKYLRDLTRTPRVRLSVVLSRCLVEQQSFENHQDAMKAAFLLNIEVANASSEHIVVNSFELRFRTLHTFRRWSQGISAVALPNRVRHRMGAGTKIMRNWFTLFSDGMVGLSVEGKIEARNANSGFSLFVSHTFGSWNPAIRNEKIRVRVAAILATGQRIKGSGTVHVTRDSALIEEMVPGMLEQIRHPTSWNVPLRF